MKAIELPMDDEHFDDYSFLKAAFHDETPLSKETLARFGIEHDGEAVITAAHTDYSGKGRARFDLAPLRY